MDQVLFTIEWHLKASCTWIGSLLSVGVCLALVFIEVQRATKISKSTIFTFLIATTGLCSTFMAQTTFVQECLNAYTAPDWLIALRSFFTSEYGVFLENLFNPMLDLLIICDGLTLFIIICCPEKKTRFLSKRAICIYLVIVAVISGIIATLATKVFVDLLAPRKANQGKYAWIADIIFRFVISASSAVFHLVFTIRIRISLKKSIEFLTQSNVTSNNAKQYQRIVVFTTAISCIFFSYNIIAHLLQAWCSINQQLLANFPLSVVSYAFNLDVQRAAQIVKYLVKMLFCMKPFAFGITYIWVRYPRKKRNN